MTGLPRLTRTAVARRHGATEPGRWPAHCVYCGAPGAIWIVRGVVRLVGLTYDHWTPKARGGSDEPGNIVLACLRCNQVKAALPPEDVIDALAEMPPDPKRVRRVLEPTTPIAVQASRVVLAPPPSTPPRPSRPRCQVGVCDRVALPGKRWCAECWPPRVHRCADCGRTDADGAPDADGAWVCGECWRKETGR